MTISTCYTFASYPTQVLVGMIDREDGSRKVGVQEFPRGMKVSSLNFRRSIFSTPSGAEPDTPLRYFPERLKALTPRRRWYYMKSIRDRNSAPQFQTKRGIDPLPSGQWGPGNSPRPTRMQNFGGRSERHRRCLKPDFSWIRRYGLREEYASRVLEANFGISGRRINHQWRSETSRAPIWFNMPTLSPKLPEIPSETHVRNGRSKPRAQIDFESILSHRPA